MVVTKPCNTTNFHPRTYANKICPCWCELNLCWCIKYWTQCIYIYIYVCVNVRVAAAVAAVRMLTTTTASMYSQHRLLLYLEFVEKIKRTEYSVCIWTSCCFSVNLQTVETRFEYMLKEFDFKRNVIVFFYFCLIISTNFFRIC